MSKDDTNNASNRILCFDKICSTSFMMNIKYGEEKMKMTVGAVIDVVNTLATNVELFQKADEGVDAQIEKINESKMNASSLKKFQDKMNNLLSNTAASSEHEFKFVAEQLAHERELNNQVIKLVGLKTKVVEYGSALTVLLENPADAFVKRLCAFDMTIKEPDSFDRKQRELYSAELTAKRESGRLLMIKGEDVAQIKALVESVVSTLENAKNDGVLHVVNGIEFARTFLGELDKYHVELNKQDKKDVEQEKVSSVTMFKGKKKKHKKPEQSIDSKVGEDRVSSLNASMSK